MGETFVININCSKILRDSDETQYTMFIDSTKMSIVYEFVEWIRWMFSLKNCFYITHDNSVIHELEDIQVLSRLKNFEVKPCGRSLCVHKNMYRTLLKNINLFVSWNGIEVHRYFLYKLNQVDQKLTPENSLTRPMIYASENKDLQDFLDDKNTKADYAKDISPESSNLFLCENKIPQALKEGIIKRTLPVKAKCGVNDESPTEQNHSLDKKRLNENFLINPEHKLNYLDNFNSAFTENLTVETSKCVSINNHSVLTVENTLQTVKEVNKNCEKSHPKKYVKPFSLGETLSNLREDLKKQDIEMKQKKNSLSSSITIMEEGNFDENITIGRNSFTTECKINDGRKRQRTRKRKKSKKENLEKEGMISPYSDTNIPAYSMDMLKTNKIKPNHIRFDIENDNLMETEVVENEQDICNENEFEIKSKQMSDLIEFESFADDQNKQIKNKFETMRKEINDCTPLIFSKTNLEKNTTVNVDSNQHLSELHQMCSVTNNTENKMDCSFEVGSQVAAEENLNHLYNSLPDNTSQPSRDGTENFESNRCKPDLNTLLSLKEKFKNAVVIERFY